MSRFNLRGRMTVTVHQARGLANQILIGQMDPYAVVRLSNSRDSEFKTKIAKDQHQTPVWEQSYIFNLEGKEELLHANVFHSAALTDDNIGRLDLPLDSLDMSGKPRWYSLKNKSDFTKQTGEVSMSVVFDGTGLPAGSLAFTTNQSRVNPPSAAVASPASPPPVIAATVAYASSPVAAAAPQQQQQYPAMTIQQQPQQQQQPLPYNSQQPGQPQQYGGQQPQYASSQPGQPQQYQQYQQPPYQQQQPQYEGQQQYGVQYQQQYQQPQPVYQQQQPQYQPQMYMSQQPAAIVYQTSPAPVVMQQTPVSFLPQVAVVVTQQQQQPQPMSPGLPRQVFTFQPTNVPQYVPANGPNFSQPPQPAGFNPPNYITTFQGGYSGYSAAPQQQQIFFG